MFQIVFNEISAAELSKLETLEQLELLEEFKVGKEDLDNLLKILLNATSAPT